MNDVHKFSGDDDPFFGDCLAVGKEFGLPPDSPAVVEIVNLRASEFVALRALAKVMDMHDITETVLEQYRIDELTGLRTRDAFIEDSDILRSDIHQNEAFGLDGHNSAMLFMLDLKRLHKINKSGGHAEGDRVISLTGNFLDEIVADEDSIHAMAGRLGGDEFAVIVTFDQTQHTSEEMREKILEKLAELYGKTPHGLRVGEPAISEVEKSMIDLFKEADPKAPKTLAQKIGKLALNMKGSLSRALPLQRAA